MDVEDLPSGPPVKLMVNIVVYGIVIYLLWVICKLERVDTVCPASCASYDAKLCRDGQGRFYLGGKGKSTDKVSVLLDKIEYLSETEGKTIKWRRCVITAVAITILIYGLVIMRLPDARELVLTIFMSFLVVYLGFSFYERHYYQFATQNIRENLAIIRERYKLKRDSAMISSLL